MRGITPRQMLSIPLRISTDVNLTVTTTATPLYTLMETASTLVGSQTYYDDAHANAVMITAEGGDIRYLMGTDPTVDDGTLISKGTTWYLPGTELNQMRLISVAGNVKVTVVPYLSEKGESPAVIIVGAGGGGGGIDPVGLKNVAGTTINPATSDKQLPDNHQVTVSNPTDISTLATSAQQLPDGHNVNVSNLPADYPLPATQVTTLTPPAAITGFATSAKQLPDNHQVSVSNMIAEVEKGLATSDNQTNNTQTANIVGVDYVAGKSGVDIGSESLIFVDFNHNQIHAGNHFLISDVVDLSVNNVYDMQFTTPNTTKWSHFIFKLDCESETEWYIYEGVTINTAGTAITPVNNNRNSLTASVNTIAGIINGSVVDANADTAVAGATVLEHGIIGAKKSGGNETREYELILKQNTNYCFRAIANTAGYTDFIASWYEHTSLN